MPDIFENNTPTARQFVIIKHVLHGQAMYTNDQFVGTASTAPRTPFVMGPFHEQSNIKSKISLVPVVRSVYIT